MLDDEDHLIQLAQRGDAAACAALYAQHYDAVYRYCFYRVGDAGLAQDLTSEVFVRLVEKLDAFESRGRPLLAWLYTVARNLVADGHRRAAQSTHVPLDEAAEMQCGGREELQQTVDRKLEARCLAAAMRHLTEEQRQVLLLKFVEDRGNAQIARFLGKSEGAIKSLQHRALNALRRAVLQEGCYETVG